MIFGEGMIALKIKSSLLFSDVHVIAKGVSDSSENNQLVYERQRKEITDIIDIIKSGNPMKTIYISSVFTNQKTLYFEEKALIERLLKYHLSDLVIIRLTNVVGPKQNNKNIFRYFQRQILSNNVIDVNLNAVRNVIDVDDVVSIIHKLLMSGLVKTEYNVGFMHNINASNLAMLIQNYYEKEGLVKLFSGEHSDNGVYEEIEFLEDFFKGDFINVDYYLRHLLEKYENSDFDIR
jgi:nucleoside-diphosphate-sugar epimerase